MNPALRICLLAGCIGLSLLNAQRAGSLLAQGLAGPYGAPAEREHTEQPPPDVRDRAQLPLTLESLRALADTRGSSLLVEEPWRTGLPRGL